MLRPASIASITVTGSKRTEPTTNVVLLPFNPPSVVHVRNISCFFSAFPSQSPAISTIGMKAVKIGRTCNHFNCDWLAASCQPANSQILWCFINFALALGGSGHNCWRPGPWVPSAEAEQEISTRPMDPQIGRSSIWSDNYANMGTQPFLATRAWSCVLKCGQMQLIMWCKCNVPQCFCTSVVACIRVN